ncbi:hypothetical protein BTO20_37555 (plasmid) [Mycobacterium dioxanotrophicus]|jgi:hypothetical protein|uniref:Uncharacterized protein n=1 Tax=Mycobacterium dioxanotrophicus TaxID=482462 RepID=A0A1Y0CGP9_9MYCO|nr:hypothetical protein [Mycobacterium dioxanotrophicus]ART74332.1 hypothetical protein BTO20_37555 [Mycobacterium dioxanotrophicus]
MEIDFALAWTFVDAIDGKPRQMRFAYEPGSQRGQLVAAVACATRTDNHDTIAISRTGVAYTDIEHALTGWQDWATIAPGLVSLTAIRQRITSAGLA